MKIQKQNQSKIWETIANDHMGGGVITLAEDKTTLTITMTGGKYGTINYRVILDNYLIQTLNNKLRRLFP